MRRSLLALLACMGACAGAPSAAAQPAAWVSVGGHVMLEQGRLGDVLGIGGSAVVGAGAHLLRLGPALLGADAEGTAGRITADLGPADDKITVYRGRLGFRATWWPENEEPYFVPYLRIGAVYRKDRGNLIRDEGFGWYVAGGIDYRLNDTWSIGPFAAYESVSLSIATETVIVGFTLTFSF
jgi:hypothetical protein